jgi:hypothetical protein
VDNCLAASNPDRRDTDGNLYGNRCDPDNEDGVVKLIDVGVMKHNFFGNDPDADLGGDGDGNVNFVDLGIIKAFFFRSTGTERAGALRLTGNTCARLPEPCTAGVTGQFRR